MHGRNTTYIMLLAMILLAVLAGPLPAQAGGTVRIDSALWDRAVDRLLAAGMYGVDLSPEAKATIRLQQTEGRVPGLAPDLARFSGHAITFSYRGSSGLLGFSAGYIYTSDRMPKTASPILAGLEPRNQYTGASGDDWFMAIDISGVRQVHGNLAIGLGGKTMLMKNPADKNRATMFSFLLNMPMSYKNFLTITPELQWSRSLSEASLSTGAKDDKPDPAQDTFYGGVSVTFSY